jgi:hypothetical protein
MEVCRIHKGFIHLGAGIGDHVAKDPENVSYYIIIESVPLTIDQQALVYQPQ